MSDRAQEAQGTGAAGSRSQWVLWVSHADLDRILGDCECEFRCVCTSSPLLCDFRAETAVSISILGHNAGGVCNNVLQGFISERMEAA